MINIKKYLVNSKITKFTIFLDFKALERKNVSINCLILLWHMI